MQAIPGVLAEGEYIKFQAIIQFIFIIFNSVWQLFVVVMSPGAPQLAFCSIHGLSELAIWINIDRRSSHTHMSKICGAGSNFGFSEVCALSFGIACRT